jgi:predicted  nucleic acid-binding Zn-ribbon protein
MEAENLQLNQARPQSSTLLNINDPIQVHLLVETALDDSKEYEILSPEEVDDLKKLCRSLSQRIGQTRQNLALQSKYRDAAISMSKLYSTPDKSRRNTNQDEDPKPRRSLLGHRSRNSESMKEAEMERLASERKCEDLARELWELERRLMEPQMRLLHHTAGILQFTHGRPKAAATPRSKALPTLPGSLRPGSPEGLGLYANSRGSIDHFDEDLFDDRSLYREIGREEPAARGSWDLAGSSVSTSTTHSSQASAEVMKMISTTEQRLESLNHRLREVIVKNNPQAQSYSQPPSAAAKDATSAPGKALGSYLEYLEQGIKTFEADQNQLKATRQNVDLEMEETLEGINQRIRSLIVPSVPSYAAVPALTGKAVKDQLYYFLDSIDALEDEFQRAAHNDQSRSSQQDAAKRTETLLIDLWDTLQSGEEDRRRRKAQDQQLRAQNGITDDANDSGDDVVGPPESFSVQNLSAKVQRMFSDLWKLKEQKNVLQRQIKQQRELNQKSEGEKDALLVQLEEDLARTRNDHTVATREVGNLQGQLLEHVAKLNQHTAQRSLEDTRSREIESAVIQALEEKLAQRNDEIMRLEEELQEVKSEQMAMGETQSRIEEMEMQLEEKGHEVLQLEDQLQDMRDEQGMRDAEVQSRLAEAAEKVEAYKSQLAQAGEQAEASKAQPVEVATRVENLESQLAAAEEEAVLQQKQIQEKQAELDAAQATLADLEAQLASHDPAAAASLEEAQQEINRLEASLAQAQQELSQLQESLTTQRSTHDTNLEAANLSIARLQTEVTLAKAELDGLHGTRAQRAAEREAATPALQRDLESLQREYNNLQVAHDALRAKTKQIQGELDGLKARKEWGGEESSQVVELKGELGETIEEFEALMREGVEWERERERLEQEVDRLRDEKEAAEARLSEEMVGKMGRTSGEGREGFREGGVGATSTKVLREEFKRMMRDTRAENLKALKVSCF